MLLGLGLGVAGAIVALVRLRRSGAKAGNVVALVFGALGALAAAFELYLFFTPAR
jgi:hypothetical protein